MSPVENGIHANGTNGLHSANGVNGTSSSRPLTPGIFAPIPTFFHADTEELDLEAFTAHVLRVAKAGVRPLLAGSMGEAHHLTHAERRTLITAARRALDDAGLASVPIVAGTGAGSTRETIELSTEAAHAGADYAIVILSGYYAGALAGNRAALKAFWAEVAEKSPIPVIIYNYPGASGGIDLDSDLITELAEECPNLAGVKLTCVPAHAPASALLFPRPASRPSTRGSTHMRHSWCSADSSTSSCRQRSSTPTVLSLAAVFQYTIQRLYELSEKAVKDPYVLPEAQRLQGIVARADFTIAKASIAGTKALLEKLYGYGGNPRRPLPPFEPEAAAALWGHPHTQDIVRVERELSGKITAAA